MRDARRPQAVPLLDDPANRDALSLLGLALMVVLFLIVLAVL